ncbi:sporulation protein, YlmC/YmxH family [Gracilibacillus ureilyticus]|uniref:Sporulation protein, YlmC/YmxH family n=1 Tax=Gracilibacillus ureilyticus TaxID=531814 RepID=A0A1H9KYN2_9BACI|nr:YlmC/YmxH family sporulation protein [Gracilibacillus ureilyticus]SER04270.1 sporulation protein, YlmC/YmxH family [Gracilibacillus ureilyticus]
MITLSSMQMKDIIYIEDGTKLGHLTDIEINVDYGRIVNLIVATKSKVLGVFGEEREVIIPWENVMRIGQDVILVKKSNFYISEPSEKKQT